VYKPAVFAVNGHLYGVVGGADQWSSYHAARQTRYALLPLEPDGRLWRSIDARGDYEGLEYQLRVDYTNHSIRAEIYTGGYGSSLVVEVPRSVASRESAKLIRPNMALPSP